MAKTSAAKTLRELFLERVIRIDAVQRERAEVAKTGMAVARSKEGRKAKRAYPKSFFERGSIPGAPTNYLWPVGRMPAPVYRELGPEWGPFNITPPMERAWWATRVAWFRLCADLTVVGKLICEGTDPATGKRDEIAPHEWLSDGLWVDVYASAVFVARGRKLVKTLENVTVREATEKPDAGDEAPPASKPKRKPTLLRQMVIAILREALGDQFTADDIESKKQILKGDRWDKECKAPLGNPSRRVKHSEPSRMTIIRAIEDYLQRPKAYPKRR